MIAEVRRSPTAGIPMFIALIAAMLLTVLFIVLSFTGGHELRGLGLVVLLVVEAVMLGGFFVVAPNEAKVLQLFGRYVGTARDEGLRWANPFYRAHGISVRVRNFETPKLKVHDNHGNPIEIAAVVVWRVIDTAEAMFEVDDYRNYVSVQSESALRSLATGYPYDAHDADQISLSGNTAGVSEQLKAEIQERLGKAGVQVIEARISHLAYAQEIAAAMLQRQQASAVVAARYKIVEGAVGMVENALELLKAGQIVDLDPARRAELVSNLLVVLCSDRHAQPMVNIGSHNGASS